MNKIYNRIKLLFWSSAVLCTASACSNQVDLEEIIDSTQVTVASVGVQQRAISAGTVTPDNGTYHLYYKENTNDKALDIDITDGTIANFGKTDIVWADVNQTNGFILSSSADITPAENAQNDIVWGQIKPAKSPDLSFVLTHRMAQAEIIVNLPESWTIQSVTLKNLKDHYTFPKKDGTVTVTGDLTNLVLPKGQDGRYALLLPPQEKDVTSELSVIVNTGSEDKTYHRLLPYAMREEIAEGQWKDIPLKFRAGRLLQINATITDNSSDDIYFTYATLTDWVKIVAGTFPIRPAGIYITNDLNKLITAWNTDPKDETLLRKYGSKDTNNKWTFDVKANINATTIITSFTTVNASTFYLQSSNNKTITGRAATDLGLTENATCASGLFVTPQP